MLLLHKVINCASYQDAAAANAAAVWLSYPELEFNLSLNLSGESGIKGIKKIARKWAWHAKRIMCAFSPMIAKSSSSSRRTWLWHLCGEHWRPISRIVMVSVIVSTGAQFLAFAMVVRPLIAQRLPHPRQPSHAFFVVGRRRIRRDRHCCQRLLQLVGGCRIRA